ncbi:MAG: DegV family protein [Pseudobutyrivibrio sp.]|nr:DegV family protein [Pseudobutyrivibrio sp.]
MNGKYIISCCSTADVTKEYLEEKDVKYICFHYYMDDVEFRDDLYQSKTPEEFYKAMDDGAMTRTSQVNTDEFIQYLTPYLEDGYDVIHLTLSSGISGVFNSAQIAEDELREMFPERKIYMLDSLSASAGYGLMVDKMAKLRDEGMSIDDLAQWVKDNRLNQNTWFFSTDLTYFIRGGRVSKMSGWFGTKLNICPLLNVNNEGKLIARTKNRGKKMVKKAIVDTMKSLVPEGEAYNQNVFITHSLCIEDAKEVAAMIEEAFPNMSEPIRIFDIGPTIGSHTGPGTVAVGFWGEVKGE